MQDSLCVFIFSSQNIPQFNSKFTEHLADLTFKNETSFSPCCFGFERKKKNDYKEMLCLQLQKVVSSPLSTYPSRIKYKEAEADSF